MCISDFDDFRDISRHYSPTLFSNCSVSLPVITLLYGVQG